MKPRQQKFGDILTRFRNDVQEFSHKFGGVSTAKKSFKPLVSRKHKRKLERKLKHAKNLAFRRAEKMPTLDDLLKDKRLGKSGKRREEAAIDQAPANKKAAAVPAAVVAAAKSNEKKGNKKASAPAAAAAAEVKKPTVSSSLQLIENRILSEENKKKTMEQKTLKMSKKNLVADNERDDKEISKLEKLLRIKKTSSKYKQAFYDEGFADLLDFCDADKRKEMLHNEGNLWFDVDADADGEQTNSSASKKHKKESNDDDDNSSQSDMSEDDDDDDDPNEDDDEDEEDDEKEEEEEEEDEDEEDEDDGFFKKAPGKKAKSEAAKESTKRVYFSQDDDYDHDEDEDEDEDEENEEEGEPSPQNKAKKPKSEDLKEDIYGRLVDKKGNVVKSEKYVPPGQRLRELLQDGGGGEEAAKLARLSKKLNGLLNRLSTSNMHSISNELVQMFYSNEHTRHALISTLHELISAALIKPGSLTPIRLIVENAALVAVLSSSIGVELGATLLQHVCTRIEHALLVDDDSDTSRLLSVEDKTLDNLVLLLCNMYNFRLFSAQLIVDLLNTRLVPRLAANNNDNAEKCVELIMLVLRSVGFALRKEAPLELKQTIVQLQSTINLIKSRTSSSESDAAVNNRLRFMIESINALKNNDVRRLDTFDQQPIEQIRKQMKHALKDDVQLNVAYKDIVKADELGRWWIVGSAWSLGENNKQQQQQDKDDEEAAAMSSDAPAAAYSERILELAREQHMNTDIRRAIFCILVSAEDYTDAFMKLMKLSLKKQQEREIVYVIVHCALGENKYNPYYSYAMQKFVDFDRRFKMTLQFHTWDKFKLLTSMSTQQISNFAAFHAHLINSGSTTLSILKNVEFGEMNRHILQFLRELFTTLLTKNTDERVHEIFARIATTKALYQLRNALKLFIVHFMLTDKGKEIEIDEQLKAKCQLAQAVLSLNSND